MGHSPFAFAMFICAACLGACNGSRDGGPSAQGETTGNAATSGGTVASLDATTPNGAQTPGDNAAVPSSAVASLQNPVTPSTVPSEDASPEAGDALGMTGQSGSPP